MNQDSGADKKKNRKGSYFDYSLLFIIIFLLCFGLIMLYSASSYEAQAKFGSSVYYLEKQIKATAIGLAAMVFLIFVDYHYWIKLSGLAYIVSVITILLVKTPLGIEANGATRWIEVGGLSIQPSEFAKIAVILFLTSLICKVGRNIKNIRNIAKIFLFVTPIIIMVIVLTQNLSTGIIITGIAVIMIFVACPQYAAFIGIGIFGVGAAALLVYAVASGVLPTELSFRLTRIQSWLNPEAYAQESGFQTLQALYAIGSGGIFGKGLGKSIQKMDFLPEAQNDMIFSIICEELGLFGAISVILLFILLIWRFMIIANNAPDLEGAMIVVGVMAHIAIQVILNIAVVTNSIPNTGITLPFISYGGTSILFLLAEMGLVLSVSRRIKLQEY